MLNSVTSQYDRTKTVTVSKLEHKDMEFLTVVYSYTSGKTTAVRDEVPD